MLHPVGFTDTAKRDVHEFVAEPAARIALVKSIAARLSVFPRAHKACPAFGPRARHYLEGAFTVIYDVAPDLDAAPVAVRHVWPSRSQLVADMLTMLQS